MTQEPSTATGAWFDDFYPGYTEEGGSIVADRDEMIAYAKEYDPWPIHVDEEAAARTPHGGVIASFGYTVSLFFKLVHLLPSNRTPSPGFLGGLGWQVTFHRGLRPGDEIRLLVNCKSTRLTSRGDRGIVVSDLVLVRQDGEPVVTIEVTSMYLTRPETPTIDA